MFQKFQQSFPSSFFLFKVKSPLSPRKEALMEKMEDCIRSREKIEEERKRKGAVVKEKQRWTQRIEKARVAQKRLHAL